MKPTKAIKLLRARIKRRRGDVEYQSAIQWEPGRQEAEEEILWCENEIAKWAAQLQKGRAKC